MSTVMVGSARGDENNAAYGGKAGDQRGGKEVSSQAWYKHSKGWRVFRAKDRAKAETIGAAMAAACANDLIGYDQWERYDLFKEAQKVGFDLVKVAVATECDCSELVRVCCAAAGIMDLPTTGFRTGNMPQYLMAIGEFTELTGSKYTDQPDYLGKGDILVTRTSGHTVVVLNDGDRYEGSEPEQVLQRGDKGDAVRNVQETLKLLGYDLGKSGVDGDFGTRTEEAVKAFQKAAGLTADGVVGKKTEEALKEAIEEITVGYKVKSGSWNVRKGPGTEFGTLGTANAGDKLPMVDAEGWVPVMFEGNVGWISKKAVEG